MTSLRESVRRLLSRTQEAAPPDPEYSYTIYWTKMVREWDDPRRKRALLASERLIGHPDFRPTAFERRYQDTDIDHSKHAGESILALHKVISAFESESTLGSSSSGV